jgi:MATE family multidrug resistance protein
MSLLSQSLSENRRTIALAAPIAAGHVGQMLMGLTDTILVGQLGELPLAACAFANTILTVPMVFGFALLSAVAVKVSHAHGAGNKTLYGDLLRAGTWLALISGLAVALLIQFGMPAISVFGQPAEVNEACKTYLLLCGWSVVPVFLTSAAKNFSEALSRPWPPFWIMMGGVSLNAVLCVVLIFGYLGAPKLGLVGAGLATLIARVVTAIAMFAYPRLSPALSPFMPVSWGIHGTGPNIRALIRIGVPTGGMNLSEVSGFAFGSIMMGWIGVQAIAAHQIAITCAATTFMVPMGIAQAVSVRVGQSRGANRLSQCRPIVAGAQGLTVVIMSVFALVFIVWGGVIASWFGPPSAAITLAAQLLLVAGIFQIVDGIQVVAAGGLRGFEDTRVPMFVGVFAFWMVGLPVSYVASFILKVGAWGVWLGFVCGLTVSAIALSWRLWLRIR